MRRTSVVLFALGVAFASSAVHAENVLDNPDFDTDLASWSCSSGNGAAVWDSRDVDGAFNSGSAQIDNNAPSANATVSCVQCLPVEEGDRFKLSTRVYFAEEGAFTLDASARVQIVFSDDVACSHAVGFGDVGILQANAGNANTWVSVSTQWNVAPTGATHAAAILLSWANVQGNPARTHFDAVVLDDKRIFSDGFESGDTSVWSATQPPTGETGRLVGMTQEHNYARDDVDGGAAGPLPHLTWSVPLATEAQAWADHLAATGCSLAPSGSGYGETLFLFEGIAPSAPPVAQVWRSGMSCYTYGRYMVDDFCDTFTCGPDACDNYIQMVWRDTATLGCGIGICPGPGEYKEIWCCFYDPPGKIVGEYPY